MWKSSLSFQLHTLTSEFWKLFSMRVGSGHETTHFSILQATKSWAGPGNKANLCQLCGTDGLYLLWYLGEVWQQPHWCSEEDKSPPNTDLWTGLPPLLGACLQDSQVRDSDMVLPWFINCIKIWESLQLSWCSNHEWGSLFTRLCISHVLLRPIVWPVVYHYGATQASTCMQQVLTY